MKLGVIGCGVVGGALVRYLEKQGHTVLKRDPALGFSDEFFDKKTPDQPIVDAIFICVPVPTQPNGVQDQRILKEVIKDHASLRNTPIFIRSTVLPKTTDHLRKFLKLQLWAMPEFLTEREADQTMGSQGIICGGPIEDRELTEDHLHLLESIFPSKDIELMANREAELAKYAHNCFGALKVNFFNLVKKYSETIGADYGAVLTGVLMSGYVNAEHTKVPGPDGKFGFGGACFPKDLAAFVKELKRMGLQFGSCETVIYENLAYRTAWKSALKPPTITYPPSKELNGEQDAATPTAP